MIKWTQYLPLAMIGLSLAAAVVYVCAGDWRRAVYWFAAAVLNISVTF